MKVISSIRGAVLLLVVLAILVAPSQAKNTQLGKVDFPVTGSEQARAHFLRGLAALHSFWFEEALEAFRDSTRAEPNFLMGYWGEAMAHNHPLWNEQDTAAAKKVLEKIKDGSGVTERERRYIQAVRVLYGEGDKLARDVAYSKVMEKLYRDYPDDLEAASFYALSLLGAVRPGDKGFSRQMKAGAIALDVYEKNPDHPGAAHYIIHSFDDPEHAILALPAARRYAEIAPAAHHARHMPSHIFLQLGMWPEAATSNESAWAVSDEWVKRKSLSLASRDYHSLHWLLYIYLQEGRYANAERLLDVMRQSLAAAKDDKQRRPGYLANSYAEMASIYVMETEKWELAEKIFNPAAATEMAAAGADAGHAACNMGEKGSNRGALLPVFVRGIAAANSKPELTQAGANQLREVSKTMGQTQDSFDKSTRNTLEIRILMLSAVAAAAKKNYGEAVKLMDRAVALEEEMPPPSGPPTLIKPAHELYGEILLRANRPREAAEQFAKSLARQPNRARSLLGAARAAAGAGDAQKATTGYSAFLRQWQKADAKLPEAGEAQEYLKQASARK